MFLTTVVYGENAKPWSCLLMWTQTRNWAMKVNGPAKYSAISEAQDLCFLQTGLLWNLRSWCIYKTFISSSWSFADFKGIGNTYTYCNFEYVNIYQTSVSAWKFRMACCYSNRSLPHVCYWGNISLLSPFTLNGSLGYFKDCDFFQMTDIIKNILNRKHANTIFINQVPILIKTKV